MIGVYFRSFTHRYAIRALRELAAPSACSEGRSDPILQSCKIGAAIRSEYTPTLTSAGCRGQR